MPPSKSKILRSWPTTFAFLGGFVACTALSYLLFRTIAEGPVTIGIALIPGVVAIILLVMAFSGAGTCACPGCGAAISGISTGSNEGVLCDGCLRYFEGSAGELWATDESKIADTPQFTSPLPESFAFPEGCCVCGAPATRDEAVSIEMMNASSAVTANLVDGVSSTRSTRTTVQVPHCAEHKGGASLTGTPAKPHIRFRSYPYLRAFCAKNGTKPG